MDKRTSSGSVPLIQEQRDALRSLRDCGVIRARGRARHRFDALVIYGLATCDAGNWFADYRLTATGNGLAFAYAAQDRANVS